MQIEMKIKELHFKNGKGYGIVEDTRGKKFGIEFEHGHDAKLINRIVKYAYTERCFLDDPRTYQHKEEKQVKVEMHLDNGESCDYILYDLDEFFLNRMAGKYHVT